MPPKRKPVKRKSLKNLVVRGTKQKQSQSQSVVVNINKTKSKPRKKSGRGGLPPPSYQHNLAPTFVTQQATDYTPIIGSIASLTSRLQQEPRIQQPVTPLSSATSFSTQQAQSMAGVKAEERREGPTAGNFQPLPSQADERLAQETQDKFDVQDQQAFEQKVSSGGGQVSGGGGQMAGESALRRAADSFVSHASQVRMAPSVPVATVDFVMPRETIGTNRPSYSRIVPGELIREADEYTTDQLVKHASEKSGSSVKMSSDSEGGGPAGGGGPPQVRKTPPKALARARQQTQERKERLDSIREKVKNKEQVTNQEIAYLRRTKGTKKILESLNIVD